jgi:glutathione-regulated potassium-efflux system ancillary protein KefG
MKRVLVLFAHPRFEKSRVNRALLAALAGAEQITVHDLYEQYPDFNVHKARERDLLLSHQVIVWQHPIYMYGPPALVKQWIDVVLEHGWAHGPDVNNLADKIVFNAVTTGGTRQSYSAGGFNRFTLQELLRPFEQTAHLCRMVYLPPFAVQGTYLLNQEDLLSFGTIYRRLLDRLSRGTDTAAEICSRAFLDEWIRSVETGASP